MVESTRLETLELFQGGTLLLQAATPLHGVVRRGLSNLDDVYVSSGVSIRTSAAFAL